MQISRALGKISLVAWARGKDGGWELLRPGSHLQSATCGLHNLGKLFELLVSPCLSFQHLPPIARKKLTLSKVPSTQEVPRASGCQWWWVPRANKPFICL